MSTGRSAKLTLASWPFSLVTVFAMLCATFLTVVDIEHVACMSLDRLDIDRNELQNPSEQQGNSIANSEVLVLAEDGDTANAEYVPQVGGTELFMLVPAGDASELENVDNNIIGNVGAEENILENGEDMLMMETEEVPVVQVAELPAAVEVDGADREKATAEQEQIAAQQSTAEAASLSNQAGIDTTTPIAVMLAELVQDVLERQTEAALKVTDKVAELQIGGDVNSTITQDTDNAETTDRIETESVLEDESATSRNEIDDNSASFADIMAEAIEEVENEIELESSATDEEAAAAEPTDSEYVEDPATSETLIEEDVKNSEEESGEPAVESVTEIVKEKEPFESESLIAENEDITKAESVESVTSEDKDVQLSAEELNPGNIEMESTKEQEGVSSSNAGAEEEGVSSLNMETDKIIEEENASALNTEANKIPEVEDFSASNTESQQIVEEEDVSSVNSETEKLTEDEDVEKMAEDEDVEKIAEEDDLSSPNTDTEKIAEEVEPSSGNIETEQSETTVSDSVENAEIIEDTKEAITAALEDMTLATEEEIKANNNKDKEITETEIKEEENREEENKEEEEDKEEENKEEDREEPIKEPEIIEELIQEAGINEDKTKNEINEEVIKEEQPENLTELEYLSTDETKVDTVSQDEEHIEENPIENELSSDKSEESVENHDANKGEPVHEIEYVPIEENEAISGHDKQEPLNIESQNAADNKIEIAHTEPAATETTLATEEDILQVVNEEQVQIQKETEENQKQEEIVHVNKQQNNIDITSAEQPQQETIQAETIPEQIDTDMTAAEQTQQEIVQENQEQTNIDTAADADGPSKQIEQLIQQEEIPMPLQSGEAIKVEDDTENKIKEEEHLNEDKQQIALMEEKVEVANSATVSADLAQETHVSDNTETNTILTTIIQTPQPEQLQLEQQKQQNEQQEQQTQAGSNGLTAAPTKLENDAAAVIAIAPQPATEEALDESTQKPINVIDSVLNYVNASFMQQSATNNLLQHQQQQQQQHHHQQQSPHLQQDDDKLFNSKLRRYDGAQVWRIVVQNDRDKKLADELQTKFNGQLWKEVKQEVDYLLKPQVLADAEKHIRAANLSRIVLIENLQNVIEVENPPASEIAQLQNRKGHRLTWQAYHRLADIHGFFDFLAKTYPDICSVETIGYSIEKRPLKILKISNGNATNPGIWMDAGMHAREWISTATVTYIANQLVEGWDDLPEHMRNVNWYIHAVANPDGYEYSHTTDRLWRKNMRSHGRQCPGVDLNRNFGYKWGGKGTSASPCSQIYRGTKAFSEPETFYISKYISNFPRETFQAYLSFHSYGQYILYPWGYDYHMTSDQSDLDRVARQAGTTITKSTGGKYTVGSSAATLYPAAGGSDDWAKGIAGIKYTYTVEMGDTGRYGFVLPASHIEPNGKDGYTFVEIVARAVTQRKQSRKHTFSV